MLLRNTLVDTGATYTVMESSVIETIRAFPLPVRVRLELGNGEEVRARAYAVVVRIGSRCGPAIVLTFRGAKRVVGVETLENLGLNVDLKKRRLVPSRAAGTAYFY